MEFPVDPILLARYRASVNISTFPHGFRKWYNSAKPEELDAWYLMRYKCLKYHLYLGGFITDEKGQSQPILGMDFQENPHDVLFHELLQKRPGEGVVISDLELQFKKRMILWSRGTYKTSAIVVDIIQTILNYPNVRICFLTGNDELAKVQLERVKAHFEHPTPLFMHLFPEFCTKSTRNKKFAEFDEAGSPDPRAWGEDSLCELGDQHRFTVPCRTSLIFAEPTFQISTARKVKAGSHFDFIYIDDLVNEQNYQSIKALTKCYQNYIDLCPTLDPAGYIIMTGTRYSFGDTYERIQENAREEERLLGKTIWRFSIRGCWTMGCKNCKHNDLYHDYHTNILKPLCAPPCDCRGFEPNGSKGTLFPVAKASDGRTIGFTLEWLEAEKIRIGPDNFANQYENNPIATGTQTFTEDLIVGQTIFDLTKIPVYAGSRTYIIGDLAYVGQEGRDYSVLYAIRVYQGQVFIFDCEFGNWSSTEIAVNTMNMLCTHRPDALYYEKFNGWEAYDSLIRIEAQKRGLVKVPLFWMKGSQADKAKLVRIGSIQGMLTSKRLWLYGGMKGYAQLMNQLVKWPKLGRHDDFADCAGMAVTAPTGFQMDNPPEAAKVSNWLRKLNQDTPPDDSYRDYGCGTGIVC